MSKVIHRRFYAEYFGHEPELLRILHDGLRSTSAAASAPGPRPCIFLAGDSSLDNKVWFDDTAPACNGYEGLLEPPIMKQDVAYWINHELAQRGLDAFCLNMAVEATSLNSRAMCTLLAQDHLIRENITPLDTLVVSVGGNDLALNPVLATVANLVPLLCCTPQVCIEQAACACPINSHVDCGCLGCGLPGCLSGSLCGWPPGMGYFVDLFGHRVENYVKRLLNGRRLQRVVICMIYFLDVHGRGSWADCFLSAMCYDCAPSRLQAAIRQVFELATKRIHIPGVEVVALPLFEALDGADPRDYVQRVEPSPRGGQKMAKLLLDTLYGSPGAGSDDGEQASPGERRALVRMERG